MTWFADNTLCSLTQNSVMGMAYVVGKSFATKRGMHLISRHTTFTGSPGT